MPKIKKKAWSPPTSENPVKEMQWCFDRGIRVCVIPEANKVGRNHIATGKYGLEIKRGSGSSFSGYLYTSNNINEAINETYRKIYQLNNGKKK